jgi:prepilin-type N-terminal cleavage/methylation domain-containing protein
MAPPLRLCVPSSLRLVPRGFTVVELLTVVAIMAVLIGLLFPALSAARRRAYKTNETNDLRQIGMAWTAYSNSNNDAVLPGFLATEVQQRWKVTYDFPNRNPVPPAPDYGQSDPNAAGPWAWRLLPYLSYSHEVVQRYSDKEDLSQDALMDEAEEVAYTSAFGYNAYYMGGWWNQVETFSVPVDDGSEDHTRARMLFHDAVDADTGAPVSVVTQSIPTLRRSSGVVIFCSSAHLDQGVHKFNRANDQRAGAHFVSAPIMEGIDIWRMLPSQPAGGGGSDPSARIGGDPSVIEVLASEWGGVAQAMPIGRYNGQVACLYGDGHIDQQLPGTLQDQRFWIDAASCPREENPCQWTHMPAP